MGILQCPISGAVKVRAKRTAFRNVWNHSKRMALDANCSRIGTSQPCIWNLSFTSMSTK